MLSETVGVIALVWPFHEVKTGRFIGKAGRLTYVGKPSRLDPGVIAAGEGKAGRLTY
jgi:hypothetical protein